MQTVPWGAEIDLYCTNISESVFAFFFIFLFICGFDPLPPQQFPVENNRARRPSEEQRLMAAGMMVMIRTSGNRRAGSEVMGCRAGRKLRDSWVKATEGKHNTA